MDIVFQQLLDTIQLNREFGYEKSSHVCSQYSANIPHGQYTFSRYITTVQEDPFIDNCWTLYSNREYVY